MVPRQRFDHQALDQRGERARRRIGRQQSSLVIDHRAGSFDDDGDLATAGLPPPLQSLEAIDHFESAFRQRSHTQRQFAQFFGRPFDHSRAEPLIRGLQRFDGHEQQLNTSRFVGESSRHGRWRWQVVHAQKVAENRIQSRLYSLYNQVPPGQEPSETGLRSSRRPSIFTISSAGTVTTQNGPEIRVGSKGRLAIFTIIPERDGWPGGDFCLFLRRALRRRCCLRFCSTYWGWLFR